MSDKKQQGYDRIDQMYQAYLNTHQDMRDRWLLEQTLYTGYSRRQGYSYLQIPNHARVLDLGTGYGALALDLAVEHQAEIYAVDSDPDKLSVARIVTEQLRKSDASVLQGDLYYQIADIYQLPYDNGYFDVVTARFLFQHLDTPLKAMEEIFRVLKPGGIAIIFDIDDSLAIIYPPTPGFETLHHAFTKQQESYGGDRLMGRKLSVLLQQAGFQQVEAHISIQSNHSLQKKDDFSHQFVVRRFVNSRDTIVQQGIISAEEYDQALRAFAEADGNWEFVSSGQVVATGKKSSFGIDLSTLLNMK